MKCTDFKNLVDEYSTNELSVAQKAGCDVHLSSCKDCTALLASRIQLLDALKTMPVAGPSQGFEERVLKAAINQGGHDQHRRGFMVGFGSAAVAALALWVVVGVTPYPVSESKQGEELAKVTQNADEKTIPEFAIALNEQRDIRLAFYSAEELKGAQITLQVPESVAVVGFPGQRELAWKTNLAKGNNMLRLPVIATGANGGQLVAQIEYMGKVKRLKVNLAVGKAGVSGSTGSVLHIG